MKKAILILTLIISYFFSYGEEILIYPSDDCTVSSATPNLNLNGQNLTVGVFGSPYPDILYYSFIKFDLSSIPPNAIINSAELAMRCITEDTYSLYIGLAGDSWDENTVTYNNKPIWPDDCLPVDIIGCSAGWNSYDVADFVTSWIDGSCTNNGFAFWTVSTNTENYANYYDSESSNRPGLIIYYSVPPWIVIDSPYNGQSFETPNITVTGTSGDPDGVVQQVQVKVNDGGWSSAGGSSNWTKSITLQEGSNTIYARAIDDDGLYSEIESVNVTYNPAALIPPWVLISSPYEGQSFETPNITVTGTSGDPDGVVQQVQVKVNDGGWSSAGGSSNWTKSITLQEGSNTIYARAIDDDGLYSEIESVNVTYNTGTLIPPWIVIDSPYSGEVFDYNYINVWCTTGDSDGITYYCEVKVNNGPWWMASFVNENNGIYTYSKWVTLQPGPNTIYAKAIDDDGLYSEIESVEVIYDISIDINSVNSNLIKIYPNPANEIIRFENVNSSVKQIEIYDIFGVKFYTSEYKNTINISRLANGIYLVRLIDDSGKIVHLEKVVKK